MKGRPVITEYVMNTEAKYQIVSLVFLLSLMAPLCVSAETMTASFDCAKAQSDAEKLVCSDKQLAMLDRELARIYKRALNSPDLDAQGKKYLKAYQRGWIKGRDEAWKADDKKAYVTESYLFRIAEILKEYPAARDAGSEGISSGPFVYSCKDKKVESYFVQGDPPRAILYLENMPLVFTGVRTGSGAKYSSSTANGDLVFWSKGDEAMLTTEDGKEMDCLLESHR